MRWKYLLPAAAIAAGIVVLASTPGMAATTGSMKTLKDLGTAQSSPVQKTWGWHRQCRRGLNGWHKHVKGIGRVQCTNRKCNRHGKCVWY